MKSVFVAAIIATACSGVAMAGELKQDQKTAAPAAPAVKAQVMSDSDMDKVTAGFNSATYGQYVAGGAILYGGYSGTSHPPGNRH
jgi:hypothetical protein